MARIELDYSGFKNAFKFASLAMSNEETRYYLNGIYFQKTEKGLTLIATDGHRLQSYTIETPMPDDWQDFIMPKEIVNGLLYMSKKANCYREYLAIITYDNKKVTITLGDISYSFKPIDGKFPNYEKVIPKDDLVPAVLEFDSLNARYLSDILLSILEIASDINPDKFVQFFRSKSNAQGTPIVVKTPHTTSVIMPARA